MRREDNPARPDRDVTQPRFKPSQSWVCGYTDLGQCCRSGPTCDGRCGRTIVEEPSPTASQADATASESPAVELPPCIPRRSLAIRRQSLRLNLAILTGGLLMLCMTLPSREKIFVPGELSSKHAQILDNTVASQRCGLCHPTSHAAGDDQSATPALSGLLNSARRLIENDGRQDQLCMQCHQGHMPAAANRDPHDLSPEMWRKLQQTTSTPWQLVSTRTASDSSSATASTTSDQSGLAKTSCAMCHNEHHGRGFDIKLISDSRCQACHQRQFESLASGHPEFKDFPVDRPRGLAFSHGAHAENHFPKKNRDFDCKACHVNATSVSAGSLDVVTRSLSFEHACASCHEQPIRAATVDGWAAVQLPSIEPEDATSDAELRNWPGTARYGYDGVVSPVMRALLMADAPAASALESLPASGKILELSSIASVRASVARTLSAATKRLLEETARDGQAAWIARLQKVTRTHLNRDLTAQDQTLITSMVAGLPPDLFRHVESQWFGATLPLAQIDKSPIDQGRGRLIAAASKLSPQSTPSSSTPPTGNDDLLSDTNSVDDSLLGTPEPESQKPKTKLVKGATHLTGGGWYADQATMSIRYMPSGHADPTLAAWSLWWSMMESHKPVLPTGDAERLAQQLTLSPSAMSTENRRALSDWVPGNCAQCHQLGRVATKFVSATKPTPIADHYQVPERSAAVREFTKFQHSPHLTLPALSDCRYCHQDKKQQPVVQLSALTNHHPAMSEFATMKTSQCAACHRPGGANDRCVQCHNYHVNEVGSRQ